jgi:maltooligosyltrehalose trehalohydrolase
LRSKLDRELRFQGRHKVLYSFYRELIRLRRELPALRILDKERLQVRGLEQEKVLFWCRWSDEQQAAAAFHFGKQEESLSLPLSEGIWRKQLDSADTTWSGPGSTVPLEILSGGEVSLRLSPESFALFVREKEI